MKDIWYAIKIQYDFTGNSKYHGIANLYATFLHSVCFEICSLKGRNEGKGHKIAIIWNTTIREPDKFKEFSVFIAMRPFNWWEVFLEFSTPYKGRCRQTYLNISRIYWG